MWTPRDPARCSVEGCSAKAEVAALEQAVEDQRKLYANCVELAKEVETLREENERLRQVCRNAYEVWAGSEGIPEPKYASEAYLLQLLRAMTDEVLRGIR